RGQADPRRGVSVSSRWGGAPTPVNKRTSAMPPRTLILAVAFMGTATAHESAQAPKVWTPQELFQRNIGTREQQETQFPPHKVIGNIYYVGTEALAAFLITTPQGHILVNSMYERTVPVIR